MVVYVDDMLMLSPPNDTDRLWQDLLKNIQFEDPAAPLQRYLGALYHFDPFNPKKPRALRSLMASMDDCGSNAVQRFKVEFKDNLTRVASP